MTAAGFWAAIRDEGLRPEAAPNPGDGPHLSPDGLQNLAAMNARTYAMTDEDRDRWYAEHPVEMFREQI